MMMKTKEAMAISLLLIPSQISAIIMSQRPLTIISSPAILEPISAPLFLGFPLAIMEIPIMVKSWWPNTMNLTPEWVLGI